MTLKQFIKVFDDMNELQIYDWNKGEEAEDCLLFKGYTFDDNADIMLNYLYSKHYVLELNEDDVAVMLFPYVNEHDAKLCKVQVNVRKAWDIFDYLIHMIK